MRGITRVRGKDHLSIILSIRLKNSIGMELDVWNQPRVLRIRIYGSMVHMELVLSQVRDRIKGRLHGVHFGTWMKKIRHNGEGKKPQRVFSSKGWISFSTFTQLILAGLHRKERARGLRIRHYLRCFADSIVWTMKASV